MSLMFVITFKRRSADNEFVGENAQAPDIDTFVVRSIFTVAVDHLRREVVQSATHRVPAIGRRMYTPPEISQLDHTKAVEKVLRLNVSVDYILGVNIFESLTDLKDVAGRFLLAVPLVGLTLQVFVELTVRAVF